MTANKRTIVALLLVILASAVGGFMATITFSAPIYSNYVVSGSMPVGIDYVAEMGEVWA
jgi:hypothetical protein